MSTGQHDLAGLSIKIKNKQKIVEYKIFVTLILKISSILIERINQIFRLQISF